ncbi:MAG: BMP family ABC transporter substrate-binding protein [Eubacteriales bacterium]|nr:BMP family ABC transporter substrate-binding protein [Eubacteriales bacterium]
MFKKILSLALIALMLVGCVTAFASCSGEKDYSYAPVAKENLKVGLICLHDENSTYDKNFIDAMKEAVKEMGLKDDQLVIKTNIPESDDAYKAAVELADAGCQLIFADSFGHEDFIMKAAEKYPNVQFCHATGTKAHASYLGNYHNAFASIYEGRYAAGIIAGYKLAQMEEKGQITSANKDANGNIKIGYVGAFPFAEVISGFTSYYLGVKEGYTQMTGNEAKIVMDVQYTNSWYDEAKEKETALKLIENGAAIISQHADSMGAPNACKEKNVPNICYNVSTKSACPDSYLVASRINWAPYYKTAMEAVIAGVRVPEDYCGNIYTGSVELLELNESVLEGKYLDAAKDLVKRVADKEFGSSVFDITKFTVDGKMVESYKADVNTDANYTPDTEAVYVHKDESGKVLGGYFYESQFRSAPYFNIIIDGINVPKD